jgi:hypothetical protein
MTGEPLYTHVGYRRRLSRGTDHGFSRGHGDFRGARHALRGCANIYSGATYRAMCGGDVGADHDGYGFNVAPAEGQGGAGVTCRRCRKLILARGARP